MKLANYIKEIEKFLFNYLKDTRCETFVLGVSGGVDSSLVAALCKEAVGKEHLHCLIIPIESSEEDIKDALTLVKISIYIMTSLMPLKLFITMLKSSKRTVMKWIDQQIGRAHV